MIRLQPRTRHLNTTPSLLSLVLAACVSMALPQPAPQRSSVTIRRTASAQTSSAPSPTCRILTVSINRT